MCLIQKFTLDDKEQQAICDLRAIAAKWPKKIWLFCSEGNLYVMKCARGGKKIPRHDYIIEVIENIPVGFGELIER